LSLKAAYEGDRIGQPYWSLHGILILRRLHTSQFPFGFYLPLDIELVDMGIHACD